MVASGSMNGQPPLIRPDRRWDWFDVEFELGRTIAGTPGVRYVSHLRRFAVHRTHLPLLPGGPEVLAERTAPLRDHATRSALVDPHGIVLRPNQQTALDFIEPRHGVLLADEMRLGKGQPASSSILTPTGWRRFGDLRVGDAIVDPDGGAARVLEVYPRGVQPVYRVTFSDDAVVECDGDHLWLVQTSLREWRGQPPRVLALSEILQRGLRKGVAKPHDVWIVPLTVPVEFDPVELPIDPYALGLILGDGSLRRSVSFTSSHAELQQAVISAAVAAGHRVRRSEITSHISHGTWWRQFEAWGLANKLAHEKFVPDAYLRSSVADRLALLRGLMDTDGYAGPSTTEFYTTSALLRDAVIEIVRSLGGLTTVGIKTEPRFTYRGEERIGRTCHVVRVRLSINPFKLQQKHDLWCGRGQMRRTIANVEHVRDEATTCIRVSSRRSLYITDGYVVTHNTLTALAAHDPNRGPLLVVAPLSTRNVWLEWMRRLWPEITPVALTGRTMDAAALQHAQIVFCHYDILAHHRLGSFQPSTLIVDEAHVLSNANADRTKAIFFYTGVAWRTILLTGTPLWNTSKGLWSLLAAVNPGAWGTIHTFAQRYCMPQLTEYGWKYTGVSNADEWALRRDEVLIARRWEDVRADLPPTQWSTEVVDLGPKDHLKIDQIAFEMRRNERAPLVEALNYYRQATGMFKVPLAIDYAQRVIAEQRDLVVWVWHRRVGDAIAAALKAKQVPTMLVHGELSEGARVRTIDAWKTSPDPAVLVISIDVGQVGIDLSRAHHALFVELSWNPVELSQASMRTFSPDRPMEITWLMLDHEIDRALVEAVIKKVSRGDSLGVLAAGSTFRIPVDTSADDDTLMAEFARAVRA